MPVTKIQTIIDKEGNTILPRTRIEAIYLADGVTLLSDALETGLFYKGDVADFASLPITTKVGDLYYVTADETHYFWNGAAWAPTGKSNFTATEISVAETEDYYTSTNVEDTLQEVGAKTIALESFAIAMAIGLS